MKRMEGKRTLVTGAASAHGKAVVQVFVENGAMVIAVDDSDEKVEKAVDALGLADSDEVITRELDEGALGAWWDLANLIAAFYHELDVFVHIPQNESVDSFPMAIDRLKESLHNVHDANYAHDALNADPDGARVVVVSADAEASAMNAARDLAREGSNIPVNTVAPGTPHEVAKTVLELVSAERSAS
jgi:hypothetical protein